MLLLEPVPEDDEAPPALEPLLGLPVVMPSSFRHFSRSLPVMPRHLLLELVLGELVLGEAPGALLPVEPVALLPDAPPEGPVLCANDTLESAKSAAAVAALRSFSVIFTTLLTCWCSSRWGSGCWGSGCWSSGWECCCYPW